MTSKNLLCLPTEILEMITLHLEYASEVNSLSQTCQRLYSIADRCLYKYYAKECPPHVLDRIVMDDNRDALYKLLVNGLNFHQYFRITDRSTPIIFTVDKDLARIAELLVAYSEVRLQSDRYRYTSSIFDPARREYDRDLEKALCRAAYKGSLGVLKVLVSSPVVTKLYKTIALRHAVKQSHLALAKYLIEEGGESANQENVEMVKLLVNAGADLKCPSFQRMEQSPLCIAAARNHGAIVQYLIEMGMCFPRVKLSDILGLENFFDLPGYTISNVKRWTDMLANARDYPKCMEVLLHRGHLDKTKDICILKNMLAGAFRAGNLAFAWRLIEHGELGLFDTLNGPDLRYHEQTVLQIAAYHSSLETFQHFLATRNLTLDPNHPTHCAALVSAAVGTNIDVVGYFLEKGFEINALYPSPGSKEDNVREALTIQVATTWGKIDESILEAVTAVMVFLLDRRAEIDTTNSQGQTALSIGLEHRNSKLARMLLSRGADPLIALESRDTVSALEELIEIFLEEEHNVSYLDMLRACLGTMAARGYRSDDFLRLMPSIEGTLSRPRVIPQLEDAPDSEGLITPPYYEDNYYSRKTDWQAREELHTGWIATLEEIIKFRKAE
ncbi:ankyrin [Penicillium desertorum]|uniref:Ankyrin n=1 Tax=Penicillium desertorum TaxID=1303715 RepID=A0A9W9WWE6_9EURO|nr:ankyrin [Penicillium desertorum]